MGGFQKSSGVGSLFKSSTYFTEGRADLTGEAIGPLPLQEFRKPIATCGFPGWGGGGVRISCSHRD